VSQLIEKLYKKRGKGGSGEKDRISHIQEELGHVRTRKGAYKMEKEKESVAPILVFLITLVIGRIILLKFVLFVRIRGPW